MNMCLYKIMFAILAVLLVGSAEQPKPARLISFYRLRFDLSTTAKATRITALDTKDFLTAHLIDIDGKLEKYGLNMRSMWVKQKGWGKRTRIVVDYAITPATLGNPIPYLFEKTTLGKSTLKVFNVADKQTKLLTEIHLNAANSLAVFVDLGKLKNIPPIIREIPSIMPRRMLWAFYYMWYTDYWDASIFQDRPGIGYYSSSDPTVIEKQIKQAQSAGIDGFIASWWGPGDYTDDVLKTLLDVAQKMNFSVMINFETVDFDQVTWGATPRDAEIIFKWLKYAIRSYGNHPAYMQIGGKPVFVIYSSALVLNETWQKVFTTLREKNLDAVFLGEYGGEWSNLESLDFFDGFFTYNILSVIQRDDQVPTVLNQTYETMGRATHFYPLLADTQKYKIWATTVEPGFDDHLIPGRKSPLLPRQDGSLYRATFDAALNSNPDWIFITSWNEWPEHTYIEPSNNYQDKYLQVTREYADRWRQ